MFKGHFIKTGKHNLGSSLVSRLKVWSLKSDNLVLQIFHPSHVTWDRCLNYLYNVDNSGNYLTG